MLVILFYKVRKTVYVPLFGFNVLIFSFVIDGLFNGEFAEQFIYDNISIDESLVYLWLINILALIIFCCLIGKDRYDRRIIFNDIYFKIVLYLCLFVSLGASLINTMRVHNLYLLFLNPREWELIWGKNVILNYLFFLHTVASFLSIIMYWRHRNNWYLAIFIVSVAMSVLHGIKFTIAHTVLFSLFAFLILNNYSFSRFSVFLLAYFVCIICLYFAFIRGGKFEGVIGYLTSPSINSIYVIQKSGILINYPKGIFIPDIENMMGWIVKRLTSETALYDIASTGFVLNEKYNAYHPILQCSFLTSTSYIISVIYLSIIIRYIKSKKHITLFNLFLEAFLMFVTCFLFWGWKLWEIKTLVLLIFVWVCCIMRPKWIGHTEIVELKIKPSPILNTKISHF